MFRIHHVAEIGAAVGRSSPWDRLLGALLLTLLAVATIGWCCLLALALWRATLWLVVAAPA